MTRFEVRLLLDRPPGYDPQRVTSGLEAGGVLEDVAIPEDEGPMVVWMGIEADGITSALAAAVSDLDAAETACGAGLAGVAARSTVLSAEITADAEQAGVLLDA